MKKFLIALCVVLTLTACTSDNGKKDPAKNYHAKGCLEIKGTIMEHEQNGGKYKTSTFWCVLPGGQITDIWFEK